MRVAALLAALLAGACPSVNPTGESSASSGVESIRVEDPLLAEGEGLGPGERNFRLNWVVNRIRTATSQPLVMPEFVAHQGRRVRIVDLRDEADLIGPQGYIPGADWVPLADAYERLQELAHDQPLVLVSRYGIDSATLAQQLESEGFLMVASMAEGMTGWRQLGFAVARHRTILDTRNRFRKIEPESDDGALLTLREIEEHVGNPFEVKWVKTAAILMHGRQHCVDGRDDSGVVGTPGGDAGEFLTTLAALEAELGRELTHDEVGKIFHRVLDAFGGFYMHTDVGTADAMIAALERDPRFADALSEVHGAAAWREFFARPPEALREPLLEYLLDPQRQGCGHLKLMWTHPDEYGVRPALMASFIRHFFESRWNGAAECEHVVLAGTHDEKAVLVVRVDDAEIFPFTEIPLVAPMCHNSQMFVSHPQVASYYRGQRAEFISRLPSIVKVPPSAVASIRARSDALAERQTMATLSRLAPGLPIFEVTFRAGGGVEVHHGGEVPSREP